MENRPKAVREFVYGKIQSLMMSRNESYVRATLAKLRRGVGKHPGSLPDIWDFTLEGLPEEFMSRSDDPSPEEWAVHLSLSLFALHQQGKSLPERPMSETGKTFGNAVRLLIFQKGKDSEEAIKRHFDVVITSNTPEELAHHLRSMVNLLKSDDIPLDYPRLAEDLYRFQSASLRDGVRLRWGQDYYASKGKEEENEKQTLS